jgi:DNA-binding PadR family transcriptional regulator
MTNQSLLPLALLYADGQRKIEGITRFQKLVFLAQEETDIEEIFEFTPDNYGPFSTSLYATLEELEEKDVILRQVETTRGGNGKFIYSIGNLGENAAEALLKDSTSDFQAIVNEVQPIKEAHNTQPLNQLLRYVYSNYPNTTEESVLDL